MATAMTRTLANKVLRHVMEIYFPREVPETIWNGLSSMWDNYLDEALGKPNTYVPDTRIFIVSKDPKVEALKKDWGHTAFEGRFASLPFCRPMDSSPTMGCELDLDICPISELKETIIVMGDLMSERSAFRIALESELMKAPSLETFAKRFPRLKPALSDWLGEGITDLPVSVVIDMENLSETAFAV